MAAKTTDRILPIIRGFGCHPWTYVLKHKGNHMQFRCLITLMSLLTILAHGARASGADEAAIPIGYRLELLVDDYLFDKLSGDAALHLHKPQPKEVVLVTDKPWEGNTCAYYTIIQDGDVYRMYYRGSHYDEKTRQAAHREVTCYAESKDGIHWTKPELGLIDFDGSKANNIVWNGIGSHNFAPFKDANPNCPPQSKYKALGGGRGGLSAIHSADAIHWSLMTEKPVITKGAFDSQNLAFWDPHIKQYREFHRAFRTVRDIMTGTSRDFLTWTEPEFLNYPGAPQEHLYTNTVRPYERAPHILLGFPTRYLNNPQQQVEPTFMTSRDGRTFRRWAEALIPITAPENRDGNRSNYMAYGLVQLPGAEKEYSVYATEAYYTGPNSRLRRFTYRVDGFLSLRAPAAGGQLVTKPIIFQGDKLVLNFATSPQGSVQIELQDADGKPIDGFALADCVELRGDSIEQVVRWNNTASVSKLAGRPVRLRIMLKDADLYSFQFR
jgi:hypothetical protein